MDDDFDCLRDPFNCDIISWDEDSLRGLEILVKSVVFKQRDDVINIKEAHALEMVSDSFIEIGNSSLMMQFINDEFASDLRANVISNHAWKSYGMLEHYLQKLNEKFGGYNYAAQQRIWKVFNILLPIGSVDREGSIFYSTENNVESIKNNVEHVLRLLKRYNYLGKIVPELLEIKYSSQQRDDIKKWYKTLLVMITEPVTKSARKTGPGASAMFGRQQLIAQALMKANGNVHAAAQLILLNQIM